MSEVLEAKEEKNAAPAVDEASFLFDKGFDCPVCQGKIKARTLRSGKARVIRSDLDLRPVYENVEPLKYDPVVCPGCGYSALARYFPSLTQLQIQDIKENICKSFQAVIKEQPTYTYEEALYRYKLCLANAIVKHAPASEMAYICLKIGWLLRSQQEKLASEDPEGNKKKCEELRVQEREFLEKAMNGFFDARQVEEYPMCGMDEPTMEYLLAELAMEFGQLDNASRLVSGIIASREASNRIKDRARDLKEMVLAKMKETK